MKTTKEYRFDNGTKTLTTCIPCARLLEVDTWRQNLGRFSTPSIFMIALILFLKMKFYYPLIPFLALVIIAQAYLSSSKVSMIIHRKLPNEYKVAQMLRYADLRAPQYTAWYDKAYEVMSKIEPTENQKIIIANYLVNEIILSGKPNPRNLFQSWAKVFKMDPEEFVDFLFENTDIIQGFSYDKGVSVLPDIWPFVTEKEVKIEIMDQLANSAKNLESASENEKQYFLEDLYLVEDDVRELIEEHGKWKILIKILDEFEPEVPPKNMFQQMRMQQEEAMRRLEQEKAMETKKN